MGINAFIRGLSLVMLFLYDRYKSMPGYATGMNKHPSAIFKHQNTFLGSTLIPHIHFYGLLGSVDCQHQMGASGSIVDSQYIFLLTQMHEEYFSDISPKRELPSYSWFPGSYVCIHAVFPTT